MKMNNKTKKTVFSVTITLVLLALIGLVIYYCSCKNGKEGFSDGDCTIKKVDDGSEHNNWQTSCLKDENCIQYWDDDIGREKCVEVEDIPCNYISYDENKCNSRSDCVYNDYTCKTKLSEGETCKQQSKQDCWKYSECVQYNYACYNKSEAPCDALNDETNCPVDKCSWSGEHNACYKKGEQIPCKRYYNAPNDTWDGYNPCPTDRCAWDDNNYQCHPKEGKTCDMYNDNLCPTDKCDYYQLEKDTKLDTEYGICVDKGSKIILECNDYSHKDYCPTDDCKFITTSIYDNTESGVCVNKDKEVGCYIYDKDYCPTDKCEWHDEMCKNKPDQDQSGTTTTTNGSTPTNNGATTTNGQVGTTTTNGQVGTTTTKGQVGTTTTNGQVGTTTTMPMGTTTTIPPVESVEEIVDDMTPADNAPVEEKQEYNKMKQNLEKVKRKVKPENVKVVEDKMSSFMSNQKQQVVKTLSTLDETQATNLNTTLPQLDTTNQKELMKVFAIPDYKQQVLTVLKDTTKTPAERKQQIVKILEKSSKDPTIQKMFVTKTVTVPVRMPQDPTSRYMPQQPSWRNNNRRNERTMSGRQASNYNTRQGIYPQSMIPVNKGVSVSNYEGVLNVFYPYMM
jgi:hypothetical protein